MRNTRGSFSLLRWSSLVFVVIGLMLLIFQLISFSRIWATYPPGLTIAGIPVGSLDRQKAAERLLEVYSLPIELHYDQSLILLPTSVIDFQLDLESMLAAADQQRTRTPFWNAFWDYLWGRSTEISDIPLLSSYSETRLRSYLQTEISSRYDQPPTAAMPIPGTANFQPGIQGTELDIDRSVLLINSILKSNNTRRVDLPLRRAEPARPSLENLRILLQQTILDIEQFDGVIGLYLSDLQTGDEITLYYNQGEPIPVPPDVAFTASSTIKIPIMVSAFRRGGIEPENEKLLDEIALQELNDMIAKSDNVASDWVMSNLVANETGPLLVSSDMSKIGLINTFLAGFFYNGAPLLRVYTTPANQRLDVTTEPDRYSQTTPTEIGELLRDIYFCAHAGGGTLLAAFPDEITQSECQMMINILKNDHTPWLILAGVPDGTEVAHKHGWVSDAFGIIHDMSDAGIVYTQGRTYVLSIFLYHPLQLVFEPSNQLVVSLSRAVYNFYNLP